MTLLGHEGGGGGAVGGTSNTQPAGRFSSRFLPRTWESRSVMRFRSFRTVSMWSNTSQTASSCRWSTPNSSEILRVVIGSAKSTCNPPGGLACCDGNSCGGRRAAQDEKYAP